MNFSTFVVLLCVCFICFLAARSIYRDKKAGKSLCGGNCGDCGHGCACGKSDELFDKIRKEQFSK